MIKFSHQMVKNFYGVLSMSSKPEYLEHLAEENNNNNIRIVVRKYTNPSQSNAMIIFIATTSFRLPLPSEYVFDFFRDPIKRAKVQKLNPLFSFYQCIILCTVPFICYLMFFNSGTLCVMRVPCMKLHVSQLELTLATTYQLYRYSNTILYIEIIRIES